jgi:hypothetical protein
MYKAMMIKTLIVLFGMVFYLWWLPHRLFNEASVATVERNPS